MTLSSHSEGAGTAPASQWLEIDDTAVDLDRETQTVRSWWITDPRLVGNPLSILMYLRLVAVDVRHRRRLSMPSQTEAMRELGLGEHAWVTGKRKLMAAGFLLEIRDRYPTGYVHLQRDDRGRIMKRIPRGGQKRYQLRLRDPQPGFECEAERAVIELDCPYEEWGSERSEPGSGYSGPGDVPGSGFSGAEEKPLITPAPGFPEPSTSAPDFPDPEAIGKSLVTGGSCGKAQVTPAPDYPDPLIGRQERIGKDGLDWIDIPVPSTPHGDSRANEDLASPPAPNAASRSDHHSRQVRIAGAAAPSDLTAIDAELRKIHPTLSVQAFVDELGGRVDVESVDLVLASREVLARAKRQIGYAPSYVAVSIVKTPGRWVRDRQAFTPQRQAAATTPDEIRRQRRQQEREECAEGRHDWGSTSWPEQDRAHCVRDICGVARASIDPEFARFLDGGATPPWTASEGGPRWGA